MSSIESRVRNLTGRYCDAVMRSDTATFTSCWAPDAEWVVPGGVVIEGRDAIVELFVKLRAPIQLCMQELLSSVIEPVEAEPGDGSTAVARARWQIRELQRYADGRTNCVLGVYTDDMVIDDGELRFSRRRFDVVYRGPLDLSGTVFDAF